MDPPVNRCRHMVTLLTVVPSCWQIVCIWSQPCVQLGPFCFHSANNLCAFGHRWFHLAGRLCAFGHIWFHGRGAKNKNRNHLFQVFHLTGPTAPPAPPPLLSPFVFSRESSTCSALLSWLTHHSSSDFLGRPLTRWHSFGPLYPLLRKAPSLPTQSQGSVARPLPRHGPQSLSWASL